MVCNRKCRASSPRWRAGARVSSGRRLPLLAPDLCRLGRRSPSSPPRLGPWLAVPLLAVLLAQHSSLQHEIIHGHPTRERRAERGAGLAGAGALHPVPAVPRPASRAPLRPAADRPARRPGVRTISTPRSGRGWGGRCGWCWRRTTRCSGGCSSGRSSGLVRSGGTTSRWLRAGDRGGARRLGCTISPGSRRSGSGCALVGDDALVAVSRRLPGWRSSILRIRTFLEHQAHEQAAGRSVIIEDRGPLSILFLNNNFHAVHHANPRLPWYRLPAEYARRREWWLRRNGGYSYRSYGEVLRRAISCSARIRWRIRSGPRRSRAAARGASGVGTAAAAMIAAPCRCTTGRRSRPRRTGCGRRSATGCGRRGWRRRSG